MNAGCYGKTISDNLINCSIVGRNGQMTKLSKKEIRFSYRKTSINDDSIITCAKFKVILNDKEEIFKK